MALPSGLTRIGISLVLLLDLAGTVIALAGLAKLTDMCRKDDADYPSGAVPMVGDRAYDCGVHYSLHWWIVMSNLFVIFIALVGSNIAALHNKHFILHTLAVSTTLFCLFAYNYINIAYTLKDDHTSKYGQASKAAAAGAVAVLVTNYLFCILFSRDSEDAAPPQPPVKAGEV